jgi:hypothetical protein
MSCRDGRGEDWADIIDMLDDASGGAAVARLLAEIDASG